MGLFSRKEKMDEGLAKTRKGFFAGILDMMNAGEIDDSFYDDLEEQLILADTGADEANNDKLLAALEKVPAERRDAKFVSAVCFYLPGGRHITFHGECPGRVGFVRRGENGFGYDPLFVPRLVGLAGGGARPNTEGRTYAELEAWEKDSISHRGAAMRLLDQRLADFLAGPEEPEACVLARSVGATIVEIDDSLGFERDEKFDGDKLTRSLR